MSVQVEVVTMSCGVCGARVSELRRGRCWGCYGQWVEQRPVGRGAACAICQEKRRDQLRLVELHSRSVPLCHGCAARTLKLGDIPPTLEGLRALLRRDRRSRDRRADTIDRRIFPRERRVGERRNPPRSADRTDPDMVIAYPEFEDLVVEVAEHDLQLIEQTLIKRRPAR
jgi:hypothetical protein